MKKIIACNLFALCILVSLGVPQLNANSSFGGGDLPSSLGGLNTSDLDFSGTEPLRPPRSFLPVRGPDDQPPWDVDNGIPVIPFFPVAGGNSGENAYCGPNALCGDTDSTARVLSTDSLCGLVGAQCGPVTVSGGGVSGGAGHSYDYVVALLREKALVCTGVLLDKKRVLTAAHCLCGALPDTLFIGSSIYDGDITDTGFKYRVDLSDKTAFLDENFCSTRDQKPNPHRDLAIIETRYALNLEDSFFPDLTEKIPDTFQPDKAIIVGFGASDQSNNGGVKSYARVNPVMCTEENAELASCLPGKEVVVINERYQDVDTCKGDSGGPMLLETAEEGSRLLAITSRKIVGGREEFCGSGGVYALTNQTDVLRWLRSLSVGE